MPSFEYPRLHGVSNLHAIRDGLRVLAIILVERDAPSAVAVPVAARRAR